MSIRIKKFVVKYADQLFMGNSIDELAREIMKRHHDVSFTEAVRFSERNKIQHENGSRAFADKNKLMHERNAKAKSGNKKTWNDIYKGAIAVLKNVSGKVAPQIEIDRRCSVCRRCPRLQELELCKPCGAAASLTSTINSLKRKFFKVGHNVDHDVKQKYCGVCDCSLSVIIPCRLEDFSDQERSNPERPKTCWIVQPTPDPKTIN